MKRRILYRVLTGPEGDTLLRLARADSVLDRTGKVTQWMHDRLEARIDIDYLAPRAGMSVASFHCSFKSATGTTPNVYHKRLRLYEGRRLMALKADNLFQIAAAVG